MAVRIQNDLIPSAKIIELLAKNIKQVETLNTNNLCVYRDVNSVSAIKTQHMCKAKPIYQTENNFHLLASGSL